MDNENSIKQTEEMLTHLKNGDAKAADLILQNLNKSRESDLFSEIGKLTRELHDALNSFKLDSRIADLAAQDIPDAKDRLEYVLKMTDEAANKTMDALDSASELNKQMSAKTTSLKSAWEKINNKQNDPGDFKIFFNDMGDFLNQAETKNVELGTHLTEILMAQDFQDLTGQVIKNVITLVHDVEESLVHTITMFGHMDEYNQAVETGKKPETGVEGPIINTTKRDDVVSNQDDVDDLLSSLGF